MRVKRATGLRGPCLCHRSPGGHAAAAASHGGKTNHALFSAEIPRHLRRGPHAEEQSAAYCDALTTRAEPLEQAAITAFGDCLQASTRLSWFSEWSRLCERELGQLRPDLYPTASELRPAPDRVASVITREAPAALP